MKNLVNGKEVDSVSKEVVEITNPYTNELIDTVPSSNEEDVDICVKYAKEAQKKWAEVPLHERGRILEKFADLVDRDAEELAQTLCLETGKPIKEARIEISNTRIFVSSYVERAKHLYGINIPVGNEPGQENTMQFTIRQPLGVVACIIPFNFPCDLFGQKVPSALIMGNSVIVKPSTYNPLTLHKYCLLLKEAGVLDGVINCLSGPGPIVGQALARHKDVHLVTLTGSTAVGKETMATASENLTHVMLELGGNDAFILDKDGDIDLAVEEMVWGRLYNTGQVCCASKRFLIHNDVKEEFTQKVIDRIKKIKTGNPIDEDTELGCLINEKAAIKVEEQVNKTVSQGAKIVLGGKRDGAFYEPTVLVDVNKNMDVMKDMEIFGPVIPICGFDTIDEAIEIANQSVYGLCGCIITGDTNNAFKVASKLEVGGAIINGASFFRSAEMPFGGWKHSGIGNEGIATTLQEMSRIKTIILKNVLK
ncbi:MAG: aldehyde dehydrogenase [Bacilli bacterium]|nr:aldehyde dehydrogenase [Bacilli bacterium]